MSLLLAVACCKVQLVAQSVIVSPQCSRAPLLGDNNNTWFSNPSASRGGSCLLQTAQSCTRASSNRLLGSMQVMFLRCRLWPVGACAFQNELCKRASHILSFLTVVELVFRVASGAAHYYLQGCQQYPVLVKIASQTV